MKKFFKFLWNILKHVLLLPFYCSLPDKYSGVTYEEWLGETNTNHNNSTNKKQM